MLGKLSVRLGAALSALLVAACSSSAVVDQGGDGEGGGPGVTPPPATGYSAHIRRTSYGIPHIAADDYRSVGYGYGYVNAEDNLCVIAEELMTIRGERSKYFGPEGLHYIVSNGNTVTNRESDFYFRFEVTEERTLPIVENSDAEAIDATVGYAAGYSRYVRELRQGLHPGRHAQCRDQPWVVEITAQDVYERYLRLALLAGSEALRDSVVKAAPPTGVRRKADSGPDLEAIRAIGPDKFPFAALPIGSNMYAIGPQGTVDGSSMLFGNPHFPWTGPERLYQAHFILPDAEIMGAALYGVPAALIGFNEHFAWSHTVSTAYRFTFYELTLNPADPTQYLFDGAYVDMEATEVSIEVLQPDGSLSTETRTLYRSHYGPMLVLTVEGVNVLDWTSARAYTMRDANAENDRLMNQFFRWNRAQSWEEFVDLHGSVLGIPWVNTTATGPGKPAYYGDVTVVPNVPDEMLTTCGAEPINSALQSQVPGLPTLNGSLSACAWRTDTDAPADGIFGPANLPKLIRDDWVHNCNDSYWATHPDELLTGYAAIIGDEEMPRTSRTRLCMLQAMRRMDGSDGREGTKFSYEQLKEIVLDSAVYTAESEVGRVLQTYCPLGSLLGRSGPVDISGACAALQGWDLKNNRDSVGGHVWREFARKLSPILATPPADANPYFLTPFDPADPANTPRDLNLALPDIEAAFADAVKLVADSPFEFDTPMGLIQHSGIHDQYIPIVGGEGFEGSFTIASSRNVGTGTASGLSNEGYEVTYGNSYIQAVTWAPDGTPRAEGFVTYSQSTDPASPYYSDLTQAYSNKQWVRFPFTEDQIAADRVLEDYQIGE